jgi:ribosomal protein S27E
MLVTSPVTSRRVDRISDPKCVNIESKKEANYVSSSWIRFAPAVAGRVFRIPCHRVLYPHSLDIGRCFHHLPFHARCCVCGLTIAQGAPEGGRPALLPDSLLSLSIKPYFPARIIAVCFLHKAKEQ